MLTRRLLLILTVSLLFALGLLMVFNTSSAEVLDRNLSQSSYEGALRHLLYGLLGTVLGFLIWKLGTVAVLRLSLPLLLGVSLLLALVAVPGIGLEVNGARRWLGFAGISFQPSEFAKVVIPCYLCSVLITQERLSFLVFARRMAPALLPTGLILLEPDHGTAMIILLQIPIICFLARVRALYWFLPMVLIAVACTFVAMKSSYVSRRLHVYLDPDADIQGTGHQPHQAKIAAGSGGILGRGFGQSLQKLSYLPEAQNDFIAAIYAEETGFVGMTVLVVLYMGVGALGFSAALLARERSERFLAATLTFLILIQAFINLGVVSGLVPSTGINLPFFSQGGTSLLANIVAVALIARADRGESLCLESAS